MTDTSSMLIQIVNSVQNFTLASEQLRLISDRIGADSSISAALAATAQAGNRKDLTTADFDNLKVCIDLVNTLFNAVNNGTVPVAINTGGTVKLGFYKVL